MFYFILFLSFFISLLFLQISNPLSLGFLIIFKTILISILMGLISNSFWFSYILFLILVGGMLILFIYSISLIFNEKFKFLFNYKLFFMKKLFMLIMFIFFMIMIFNEKNFFLNNLEMKKKIEMNFMLFIKDNNLNLYKLFNFPNNFLNFFFILILLILLVIVVKITNFYYGPIRMI